MWLKEELQGSEYYVGVMSFVDKDQLEPGCAILMHNKVQISNSCIDLMDCGARLELQEALCTFQLVIRSGIGDLG
jgi:ATP-dependent 26S proteasome regulatory subunit